MKRDKYTQTFILPDGSEIKILESYMGRYIAIPIQRIYLKTEHQGSNKYMNEKWKSLDCKKIEVHKVYFSKDFKEEKPAIDTLIVAENKDWIEYPLVSSYVGEKATNCEYFTKIEVVLMDEKYSRRLFFSWKGNFALADFIDGCADRIMDEIIENPNKFFAKIEDKDSKTPIIYLDFYSDDGEVVAIELENERAISNRIASVRVVEFTEQILNIN